MQCNDKLGLSDNIIDGLSSNPIKTYVNDKNMPVSTQKLLIGSENWINQKSAAWSEANALTWNQILTGSKTIHLTMEV